MTTSTGEGLSEAPATARRGIPVDTFPIRLRLVRIHAGDLTVREAAEKCGVNYGSWSNWENGAKPRDLLDTVAKISEGLAINYEWLLFGGALAQEGRRARVRPNQRSIMTPTRTIPDRPAGRSQRESTRPMSAVPATLRRAAPIRSAARRISA